MKAFMSCAILLCALFSNQSAAQRGGFHSVGAAGHPAASPSGGRGMGEFGRPVTGVRARREDHGLPFGAWNAFPAIYGGWGPIGGCESAYPVTPVVVVAPQPPPPPPPPLPPPEPPKPVIHEYNWPDSSNSPAAFSVVSKDGTVHFALAVWLQDGVLHYVAKDGSQAAVPLTAIDLSATRQLNAESRIDLRLPGEAPRI